MPNERKTENIIRKHFQKFHNIIMEEQQSDNKKIDKLLKNASKKGNGKGYPEFIITYKNNPNFLIVIECKADITKHKSKSLDKYAEYAVDGALLYASFLSKEYDVLAIAVSGEEENNLEISHFLQLKNTTKVYEVFDNKLLSPDEYEEGYKKDERKFNQDFQKLLSYSKELNTKLHSYKVEENKRALLISAILIALNDKAFYSSYQYEEEPKKLIESLLNAVESKLKIKNNQYLNDILTSFLFLKTHTRLSKEKHILKDLINEIDNNVNAFIKTYKYFDTLGQFYIEFLRYANADKSLGIVLTPPHITDFFCEIANINKESIVLDICAGTGGFLISAMKKMIIDAAGEKEKEQHIKEKQIIGIEYQDSIFTILASNMYIHGDGRSQLFKGSCFNQEIKEKIKPLKPNTLLLNPPYKTDKKNDKEELEFVLNGLEMIEKGGIGVVIIPMSSVIEEKKEKLLLKEKLLKKHTLEAVFSMPDELFYNSQVSVNTCVMVIKAKEPHPKGYKTFFGYFKNDGFIKVKNKGRIDFYNKWNFLKNTYINLYRNKDEKIGVSIKKEISHKDEWLAEAYINIDFNISEQEFNNFIYDYVGNLFLLKKIKSISPKSLITKKIPLKKDFQYFDLIQFFEFKKGERLVKTSRKKGNIPFITSTSLNNGIAEFIDYETFKNEKKLFKNNITIDMLANVFFHGYEYFSDDNIHSLIPKNKYKNLINKYNLIFIATLLRKISIRYGYGRQVRIKRLKNEKIALPVKNNEPDWKFMEEYIKTLPYSINI
ncbi:N-6 DNA methylase [Nautilia sp.]